MVIFIRSSILIAIGQLDPLIVGVLASGGIDECGAANRSAMGGKRTGGYGGAMLDGDTH
jgi:hypothetical protein